MLLSTQIGLNINKDKTRPIHVIYMYQTWNTVKIGKLFCRIGPLSRDRARILYLIIIWPRPNQSLWKMMRAQHLESGLLNITRNN